MTAGEGPPPRPGTAAGDGERLVSEATVSKAARWHFTALNDGDVLEADLDHYRENERAYLDAMRAALTAVAADLDRGEYDRARRDYADGLRAIAEALYEWANEHENGAGGGLLFWERVAAIALDTLAQGRGR